MSEPKYITSSEAKSRGYDPDAVRQCEIFERARLEALALIPEIERAFQNIPRPQTTRSVARGYDDEWNLSSERIAELSANDPEQTWHEVTDDAMEGCPVYFTFSDPSGWLFYLPAFMCHFLRNFPYSGRDEVCHACKKRTHVELLDESQLQCVDRFVELCRKHDVTQ